MCLCKSARLWITHNPRVLQTTDKTVLIPIKTSLASESRVYHLPRRRFLHRGDKKCPESFYISLKEEKKRGKTTFRSEPASLRSEPPPLAVFWPCEAAAHWGAGREPGNQPISVHHNSSAGKAPMKVRIMPEWRSRLTNYKSHKASLSSASRFHGNVRAVRACVWSQRGIKETFSLPWSPKHGTLTETAPHYLIYDEFQESLQCEFFFNYFCVPLLSIFHFPLKTLWTL